MHVLHVHLTSNISVHHVQGREQHLALEIAVDASVVDLVRGAFPANRRHKRADASQQARAQEARGRHGNTIQHSYTLTLPLSVSMKKGSPMTSR